VGILKKAQTRLFQISEFLTNFVLLDLLTEASELMVRERQIKQSGFEHVTALLVAKSLI